MQMALDALEDVDGIDTETECVTIDVGEVIEALRARLAQPENDFNPDWDAMAVMVEEQQRMAKRIEELEARLSQPEQEPVAGCACRWNEEGDRTVTCERHQGWAPP